MTGCWSFRRSHWTITLLPCFPNGARSEEEPEEAYKSALRLHRSSSQAKGSPRGCEGECRPVQQERKFRICGQRACAPTDPGSSRKAVRDVKPGAYCKNPAKMETHRLMCQKVLYEVTGSENCITCFDEKQRPARLQPLRNTNLGCTLQGTWNIH